MQRLSEKTDYLETKIGYKMTATHAPLVPVVPFFQYFPDGVNYIHTSTIKELKTFLRGIDASLLIWYRKTAEKIRAKKKAQSTALQQTLLY